MQYDGREHVGGLEWDAPPSIDNVEKLLRAHVGEPITAIGWRCSAPPAEVKSAPRCLCKEAG